MPVFTRPAPASGITPLMVRAFVSVCVRVCLDVCVCVCVCVCDCVCVYVTRKREDETEIILLEICKQLFAVFSDGEYFKMHVF